MYRVTLYRSTRISGKYFPEKDYYLFILADGRECFEVKNKEKSEI